MISLILWLLAGFTIATLFNNRHRFITPHKISDEEEVNTIIEGNPEFKSLVLDLEARRKRIKMASDVSNYVIFLVFALISNWFFNLEGDRNKLYVFVLILLPLMFKIKGPFFKLKKFTRDYKHQVMNHLIRTVHPSLGYEQDEVVPLDSIETSEMFNLHEFADSKGEKNYKGEDLVFGEINGVGLAFSDVEARTGMGKDNKMVFDGTFFIAEFPDSFSGKTFVVPDFSKTSMFSQMVKGDKVSSKKSFNMAGEKVDLHHEGFEKIYDIYSTDKEEVNRLFTQMLIDNMILLDSKSNDKVLVAFSFIDNKLYIGMLFNYLQFEPDINLSITKLKGIAYAYQQLITLVDIVENIHSSMQITKEKVIS